MARKKRTRFFFERPMQLALVKYLSFPAKTLFNKRTPCHRSETLSLSSFTVCLFPEQASCDAITTGALKYYMKVLLKDSNHILSWENACYSDQARSMSTPIVRFFSVYKGTSSSNIKSWMVASFSSLKLASISSDLSPYGCVPICFAFPPSLFMGAKTPEEPWR